MYVIRAHWPRTNDVVDSYEAARVSDKKAAERILETFEREMPHPDDDGPVYTLTHLRT